MRTWLSATVLAIFVTGLAGAPYNAAEPENRFKKADIGDWAAYKVAQELGGKTHDAILKLKVSTKDDKAVMVTGTLAIGEQVTPVHELAIELAKPYDMTNPLAVGGAEDVKKKEEGRETITIGQTKYDCRSVTITCTLKNKAKNVQETYEYKIWTSDDIPLGGLVKMVKKCSYETVTITLDNSGKGK